MELKSIIIKRISRVPIYHTRWQDRVLYNNHTHTRTHTRMYTHTHTNGGWGVEGMCVCVCVGGGMLDVPALSGILWSCCGGWVGVWHFVELLWGMGGCVAFCGVAVGGGWVCG